MIYFKKILTDGQVAIIATLHRAEPTLGAASKIVAQSVLA